jgi:hypothetical protein
MKPWNKGIKGIHLSKSSEFKKGGKGINWMPVNSITTRIDKSGKKRQWIKIDEPNIWIEYSKYIWVKTNGNTPRGYVVHHKNQDTLDDSIENLELLTRKEHFEIHNIGELGKKALDIKHTRRTVQDTHTI